MHRKSARRHRWATRTLGTPFLGRRHIGRKNAGPPGSRHRRPCKSSEQDYSPLNGVDPVSPGNPRRGCGQTAASTGSSVCARGPTAPRTTVQARQSRRHGEVRLQPHSRIASIGLREATEPIWAPRSAGYGRRWSVSPPPAPGGHTSIVTICQRCIIRRPNQHVARMISEESADGKDRRLDRRKGC